MTDETCENCKFWDNSVQKRDAQPDTTGRCLVKPPKASKIDLSAVWPFTEDTDWCGRWVEQPTPMQF